MVPRLELLLLEFGAFLARRRHTIFIFSHSLNSGKSQSATSCSRDKGVIQPQRAMWSVKQISWYLHTFIRRGTDPSSETRRSRRKTQRRGKSTDLRRAGARSMDRRDRLPNVPVPPRGTPVQFPSPASDKGAMSLTTSAPQLETQYIRELRSRMRPSGIPVLRKKYRRCCL